jgi:hypothetical protein
VDIATEGSVDEEEVDPRRNLVEPSFLSEIVTDAPIHLAEDPVVDPGATRGLQERMAQQQNEPSPRFEDTRYLVDRGFECIDVLERQAHHDRVERSVATRQRLRTRPQVDGSAAAFTGGLYLSGGRVEAHDLRASARHSTGNLTLPTTDVEDTSCPLEMASDQRQDLILVLRVGARRELALPPSRMTVPLPLVLHVSVPRVWLAGVATVTVRR